MSKWAKIALTMFGEYNNSQLLPRAISSLTYLGRHLQALEQWSEWCLMQMLWAVDVP